MFYRLHILSLIVLASASAAPDVALEKAFTEKVRPLLVTYCYGCHGDEKAKGGINIEDYKTLSAVRRNPKFWKNVVHQLRDEEMPPESEKKQPSAAERAALIGWLEANATRIDLESIPRDPNSGYSRIVTWVSRARPVVLQVEYFDRKQRLLKRSVSGGFTILEGEDRQIDEIMDDEDFRLRVDRVMTVTQNFRVEKCDMGAAMGARMQLYAKSLKQLAL